MRTEFPEIYEGLYKDAQIEAIKILRNKKKLINECVKEKDKLTYGEGAARLFAKKVDSDLDEDFIKSHLGRIPDEFY